MINQALKRIGLTDGEIKVYLALLELGSTSTGKLTKSSGVSGSKVYEVLDRLMNKGLANFIIKNGTKHFEATRPERLLDYLNEKEQEIEKEKEEIQKVLPQLLLKQKSAQESVAKIFTGYEGLKTANEDIIQTLKRGEEWLSMGLSNQPKPWEIYFTKRQKARAKKGIKHKHLLNIKYKRLKKERALPHTEIRFLPKDFEMPTSTEIYSDKVIIMIVSKESPMAIMIKNKAVAESFRKYFYALWGKMK